MVMATVIQLQPRWWLRPVATVPEIQWMQWPLKRIFGHNRCLLQGSFADTMVPRSTCGS